MIFRTRIGGGVPSFDELSALMHKRVGKYTYEFALVADMPNRGFETKVIFDLDLDSLASDPTAFLVRHFGREVGPQIIANTDLDQLKADSAVLAAARGITIERRPAIREDIPHLIKEGFYLLATVNQRVLQADSGYSAHTIFIYGCSPRGVIVHNPGRPGLRGVEISWGLFDRSWAFPDEGARNILAFRPED